MISDIMKCRANSILGEHLEIIQLIKKEEEEGALFSLFTTEKNIGSLLKCKH